MLSAAGGANVSFFLRECFTATFRGVEDLVTALQLSHQTVLPPNGCGEGAALRTDPNGLALGNRGCLLAPEGTETPAWLLLLLRDPCVEQ